MVVIEKYYCLLTSAVNLPMNLSEKAPAIYLIENLLLPQVSQCGC